MDEKVYQTIKQLKMNLEINPSDYNIAYEIGYLSHLQNDFTQALLYYKKALDYKEQLYQAHNNIGSIYQIQGYTNKAIESFKSAVLLNNKYSFAYVNLANCYIKIAHTNDAIKCLNKAIKIDPMLITAYSNLASIYHETGEYKKAITNYDKALAINYDPVIKLKKILALPIIFDSNNQIEEQRELLKNNLYELLNIKNDIKLDDAYNEIGLTNFYLAYQKDCNHHLHTLIAKTYLKFSPSLEYESPHINGNTNRNKKIRLGIISNYFNNHTISKLNLGVFESFNKKNFEIYLICNEGDEDYMKINFYDKADHIIKFPYDLEVARKKISSEKLDVLLYLDIGMSAFTYFLAFSRLARIQCVTWGHPDTTGIPNIDYYISNKYAETLDSYKHYSEKLILLNNFLMYFTPPKLPEIYLSREQLKLPKSANIYACPQMLFKIHPDFDVVLKEILTMDKSGVIVFFNGNNPYWAYKLKERFNKSLDDLASRIIFQNKYSEEEFLSFLKQSDVMLDTLYFGGGYTSLLALSCGLPIVTMPSSFLRGKITEALLKQLCLEDCIVNNIYDFAELAYKIANDKKFKSTIMNQINNNFHVLTEDNNSTYELELVLQRLMKCQISNGVSHYSIS